MWKAPWCTLSTEGNAIMFFSNNYRPDSTTNLDAKACLQRAGLNWEVKECPLQVVNPATMTHKALYHQGRDGGVVFEGWKALVRSGDGEVLHIAKPGYTPVQNSRLGEFIQTFVDAGLVQITNVGELKNGRIVFMQAKSTHGKSDLEVVPGDVIQNLLTGINHHDGTGGVGLGDTSTAIICQNTLRIAYRSCQAIVHRRSVGQRMDELQSRLLKSTEAFAVEVEGYRKMAVKPMTFPGFQQFVKVLVPDKNPIIVDGVSGTRGGPRVWGDLEMSWRHGKGQALRGCSRWRAFNAITDYVDHHRGPTTKPRALGSWFGAGAKLRERAFDLLKTS